MPDQVAPSAKVIEGLQDLSSILRDSQEGYRTAAGETEDAHWRATFEDLARTRAEQVEAMDRMLQRSGGQPSRSGTMSGAAHRAFLSLKSALSSNNRLAVVDEIVRGEAVAEATFDKALRQQLPEEARQVVQRLHDHIRESRDRFRELQRRERAANGVGLNQWTDRLGRTGQRSLKTVSGYVNERPLATALVALGVGFVLGALTTRARNQG